MIDNASPKKSDPIIWTVDDVADYLRMSEGKVHRLVREQKLLVVRIGKTWHFRMDILDQRPVHRIEYQD